MQETKPILFLRNLLISLRFMKRKKATEKWLFHFKKKLKVGDGTILEVNKAEIQLLEIKKQFQDNTSSITKLNEQLTSLNGGNALVIVDVSFFDIHVIFDF